MILGNRADVTDVNAFANCLAADNTNIYYNTTQSSFKKVDQKTGTITMALTASTLTSYGTALITSSSAVMVFNNSNTYFIELRSGYISNITTGSAGVARTTESSQQIAANPSTGYAIATRSSINTVTLINGNNFTVSSLAVSINSSLASCVCVKESNFLIGTNDGRVYEIDTVGSVVKSTILPVTNRIGGALSSSFFIASITYYNNYVLVSDTAGTLLLYDWSGTPTIVDKLVYNGWNGSHTQILSNSVSGTCYYTSGNTSSTVNTGINEINFEKGKLFVASVWGGTYQQLAPSALVLSPSSNILGMSTGANSSYPSLKIYDVTAMDKVNIQTRLQDPPGLDVAGRVIRIRDSGIGRTFVDTDVSISAGLNQVASTNACNYIELALITSPDKWDVREFRS